jgi:hypothetical protein
MPIRIYMSGPDSERELASLYAWLCEERWVPQHARMSMLASEPGPSDMGAAFDVVQLVVDSVFRRQTLHLLTPRGARLVLPTRRSRSR